MEEFCYGEDLLCKGIRWRVGTGNEISVFNDPWLLRPKHFKPITIPKPSHLHIKVHDLLHPGGGWNWTMLNNILWEVDRMEVNRIPVGFGNENDKLI